MIDIVRRVRWYFELRGTFKVLTHLHLSISVRPPAGIAKLKLIRTFVGMFIRTRANFLQRGISFRNS